MSVRSSVFPPVCRKHYSLWLRNEYCHRKSLIESGNNSITPPPPGFHDYFRIPDVKPQLNVEPKVPQLPITTKGVSPNLLEKTKNQEPKKRNDSGYDSAHDKNLKTRKIDIKEDQEKIKNTEDLKLKIKRIKVGEGESYYTIKKDGKEKKWDHLDFSRNMCYFCDFYHYFL